MTWTKKDYEAVAEVLYTTEMDFDERQYLTDDFASLFRYDNPNFDFPRFRDAAYQGELTRRSGKRPVWTAKTFRTIAEILKTGKDSGWLPEETHARLVRQFAENSARTNPRFDSQRFEQAARRRPEVRVRPHQRRA